MFLSEGFPEDLNWKAISDTNDGDRVKLSSQFRGGVLEFLTSVDRFP